MMGRQLSAMKAWRIDVDEAVPKLKVKASAKSAHSWKLREENAQSLKRDKETKLERIMRHPL